jgi:uncharacterized protein (TIGR02246 family)
VSAEFAFHLSYLFVSKEDPMNMRVSTFVSCAVVGGLALLLVTSPAAQNPAPKAPAAKNAAQPAVKNAAQPAVKNAAQPAAPNTPAVKPGPAIQQAPANPEVAAIQAADERLVQAFNAGKAEAVAALFHPQAEFTDEEGVTYQGRPAIQDLMTKYFAKFPGVKLTVEVNSIHVTGPVAIEDGVRTTVSQDESVGARVLYSAVWSKVGTEWLIVSLGDSHDDSLLTPHDLLEPLAFLVGDWVNEGNDSVVRISYRWSEDQNFLLADYHVTRGGAVVMHSTQRIGWDPLAGKVRSWMFDSDGGFGEGQWAQVDGSWVVKSTAVLPDGQVGSATITMTPQGKDRFVIKGTDRFAGDVRAADFEHVITRRPPQPAK